MKSAAGRGRRCGAVWLGRNASGARPIRTRPITIVVALPAGGAVDALGRVLASRCGRRSASRSSSKTWAAPAARCRIARVVRARARRLHHRARHARPICDLGRGLYAAVRHAEGPRAGRAAAERAVLDGGAQRPAGQQPQELVDLAQVQQGIRRTDHRHRESRPLLRHGLPGDDRHELSSSCPIAAARRRCRIWWRATSILIAIWRSNSLGAMAQRQHQGPCGDVEEPLVRRARSSDHR